MRTTNRFLEVNDAWNIVGRDCGRNQYGEFRCVCGKCTPLREQREDRSDSGHDGCDSGNDANDGADDEPVVFCALP